MMRPSEHQSPDDEDDDKRSRQREESLALFSSPKSVKSKLSTMIVSQLARRSVCVCSSKSALRRASTTITLQTLCLGTEPLHKTSSVQQTRYLSNDQLQSNRAAFKTMPVDLKLLEYIERIGVGIPKRKPRKRPQRKQYSRKHDTTVLDTQEELDFFRQRIGNLKKERRARKKRPLSDSRAAVSPCLPPPPFASTPSHQGAHETSAEGYKVKRRPVKVIGWADVLGERFPKNKGLPEVALAGRSNVGKSTLLNALLYGNQDNSLERQNRRRGKVPEGKKLPKGVKAVTSDRPGETRRITFYQLSSEIIVDKDDKAITSMLLVDLPGYGFAYASEEVAQDWKNLMKDYILHRGKSLKRVLLLIDARHGMKKADRDFLEDLQSVLYTETQQDDRSKKSVELPPIQLVLTKCDLVSQADLARRVVQAKEQLSDCLRREPSSLPVMLVSAKPGVGFNNVRGDRALGGVLELQREIAALAPKPERKSRSQNNQK